MSVELMRYIYVTGHIKCFTCSEQLKLKRLLLLSYKTDYSLDFYQVANYTFLNIVKPISGVHKHTLIVNKLTFLLN